MRKTFLLLLITASIFVSCSSEDKNEFDALTVQKIIDSNKNTDINDFVLQKFNDYDVIILGENKHYERIYNQKFIEFLNHWLDHLKKGNISYNKIGLILEGNQEFKGGLLLYFYNDDIANLIYHPNQPFNNTMADLEFWTDLRDFNNKVSSFNKSTSGDDPIEFTIICPEEKEPEKWTREESNRYFYTERDSITGENLSEEIKNLNGYKFVGKYGVAHIPKKRTEGNPMMPRLVNELITRGIKTYSIYRSLMYENKYGLTFPTDESDFILPMNAFNGSGPYHNDEYFDAWIYYNKSYFDDIHIINIPSINLINTYIKFSNEFSPKHLLSLRWIGWYRLTGEIVPGNQDLVQHIKSRLDEINTVEIIDNLKFIDYTISGFKKYRLPASEINKQMINITGYSHFDRIKYPLPDEELYIDFWNNYVKDNQNKIKIRLLTALLYFGTEKEKETAINKLVEITGKNFESEKEWLNWYREGSEP